MKKNVLYSLAALSALPMGASAEEVATEQVWNQNISAESSNAASLITISGTTVTLNSGAGATITIASTNQLYDGKYLLEIGDVSLQGNTQFGDDVKFKITVTVSNTSTTYTYDNETKKFKDNDNESFDKIPVDVKSKKTSITAQLEATNATMTFGIKSFELVYDFNENLYKPLKHLFEDKFNDFGFIANDGTFSVDEDVLTDATVREKYFGENGQVTQWLNELNSFKDVAGGLNTGQTYANYMRFYSWNRTYDFLNYNSVRLAILNEENEARYKKATGIDDDTDANTSYQKAVDAASSAIAAVISDYSDKNIDDTKKTYLASEKTTITNKIGTADDASGANTLIGYKKALTDGKTDNDIKKADYVAATNGVEFPGYTPLTNTINAVNGENGLAHKVENLIKHFNAYVKIVDKTATAWANYKALYDKLNFTAVDGDHEEGRYTGKYEARVPVYNKRTVNEGTEQSPNIVTYYDLVEDTEWEWKIGKADLESLQKQLSTDQESVKASLVAIDAALNEMYTSHKEEEYKDSQYSLADTTEDEVTTEGQQTKITNQVRAIAALDENFASAKNYWTSATTNGKTNLINSVAAGQTGSAYELAKAKINENLTDAAGYESIREAALTAIGELVGVDKDGKEITEDYESKLDIATQKIQDAIKNGTAVDEGDYLKESEEYVLAKNLRAYFTSQVAEGETEAELADGFGYSITTQINTLATDYIKNAESNKSNYTTLNNSLAEVSNIVDGTAETSGITSDYIAEGTETVATSLDTEEGFYKGKKSELKTTIEGLQSQIDALLSSSQAVDVATLTQDIAAAKSQAEQLKAAYDNVTAIGLALDKLNGEKTTLGNTNHKMSETKTAADFVNSTYESIYAELVGTNGLLATAKTKYEEGYAVAWGSANDGLANAIGNLTSEDKEATGIYKKIEDYKAEGELVYNGYVIASQKNFGWYKDEIAKLVKDATDIEETVWEPLVKGVTYNKENNTLTYAEGYSDGFYFGNSVSQVIDAVNQYLDDVKKSKAGAVTPDNIEFFKTINDYTVDPKPAATDAAITADPIYQQIVAIDGTMQYNYEVYVKEQIEKQNQANKDYYDTVINPSAIEDGDKNITALNSYVDGLITEVQDTNDDEPKYGVEDGANWFSGVKGKITEWDNALKEKIDASDKDNKVVLEDIWTGTATAEVLSKAAKYQSIVDAADNRLAQAEAKYSKDKVLEAYSTAISDMTGNNSVAGEDSNAQNFYKGKLETQKASLEELSYEELTTASLENFKSQVSAYSDKISTIGKAAKGNKANYDLLTAATGDSGTQLGAKISNAENIIEEYSDYDEYKGENGWKATLVTIQSEFNTLKENIADDYKAGALSVLTLDDVSSTSNYDIRDSKIKELSNRVDYLLKGKDSEEGALTKGNKAALDEVAEAWEKAYNAYISIQNTYKEYNEITARLTATNEKVTELKNVIDAKDNNKTWAERFVESYDTYNANYDEANAETKLYDKTDDLSTLKNYLSTLSAAENAFLTGENSFASVLQSDNTWTAPTSITEEKEEKDVVEEAIKAIIPDIDMTEIPKDASDAYVEAKRLREAVNTAKTTLTSAEQTLAALLDPQDNNDNTTITDDQISSAKTSLHKAAAGLNAAIVAYNDSEKGYDAQMQKAKDVIAADDLNTLIEAYNKEGGAMYDAYQAYVNAESESMKLKDADNKAMMQAIYDAVKAVTYDAAKAAVKDSESAFDNYSTLKDQIAGDETATPATEGLLVSKFEEVVKEFTFNEETVSNYSIKTLYLELLDKETDEAINDEYFAQWQSENVDLSARNTNVSTAVTGSYAYNNIADLTTMLADVDKRISELDTDHWTKKSDADDEMEAIKDKLDEILSLALDGDDTQQPAVDGEKTLIENEIAKIEAKRITLITNNQLGSHATSINNQIRAINNAKTAADDKTDALEKFNAYKNIETLLATAWKEIAAVDSEIAEALSELIGRIDALVEFKAELTGRNADGQPLNDYFTYDKFKNFSGDLTENLSTDRDASKALYDVVVANIAALPNTETLKYADETLQTQVTAIEGKKDALLEKLDGTENQTGELTRFKEYKKKVSDAKEEFDAQKSAVANKITELGDVKGKIEAYGNDNISFEDENNDVAAAYNAAKSAIEAYYKNENNVESGSIVVAYKGLTISSETAPDWKAENGVDAKIADLWVAANSIVARAYLNDAKVGEAAIADAITSIDTAINGSAASQDVKEEWNSTKSTFSNTLTNLKVQCGLEQAQAGAEAPAALNTEASLTTFKTAVDKLATDIDDLLDEIAAYGNVKPGNILAFINGTTPGDRPTASDYDLMADLILKGSVTVGSTTITYQLTSGTDLFKAVDVNNDGVINAGDLTAITNLVLYGQVDAPSASQGVRSMSAVSEGVSMEVMPLADGMKRIAINLDNNADYTAFQLDLMLPEGMTLVDSKLTERAWESHQLRTSQWADGRIRVLANHLLNLAFKGNEGAIVYFDVQTNDSYLGGAVEVNNIVFATTNAQATQFSLGGETTGVMDTLKNAAQQAKESIYDLGGKLKNGLKKGINIIRRADGSTDKVIRK